jgi:hypothetical protein
MALTKTLGLILVILIATAAAVPLSAAEKTFELKIPGCTA